MSALPFDRTWGRAQVAAFLGHDIAWLNRHIKGMQAEGFPQPLVGHRYDPIAILAWRLSKLPPELRQVVGAVIPAALPGNPEAVFDPQAWAAELDRRALALGQVGGSAE